MIKHSITNKVVYYYNIIIFLHWGNDNIVTWIAIYLCLVINYCNMKYILKNHNNIIYISRSYLRNKKACIFLLKIYVFLAALRSFFSTLSTCLAGIQFRFVLQDPAQQILIRTHYTVAFCYRTIRVIMRPISLRLLCGHNRGINFTKSQNVHWIDRINVESAG